MKAKDNNYPQMIKGTFKDHPDGTSTFIPDNPKNHELDELIDKIYPSVRGKEASENLREKAKQAIQQYCDRISREARLDELDNLPWKRADKYGINTPYVTKKWLLERKAQLQQPNERGRDGQ